MPNLALKLFATGSYRPTGLSLSRLAALLLLSLFAISAQSAAATKVTQAQLDAAVAKLQEIRPDLPIQEVYPTAAPGLFGADFPDGATMYITVDGKFMIVGDMYAIGNELANVSEQRRTLQRKAAIAQVSPADMVVFPAKGEPQAIINIFTDVDCGYCRKLHNEIDQYAELGIEVRYLAYPREGLESATADTMRSVWCSSDPATALTRAKNSQRIAQRNCPDDPVDAQYALGRQLGVSGTPSIITDDGVMLPGYVPAAQLALRLGLSVQ